MSKFFPCLSCKVLSMSSSRIRPTFQKVCSKEDPFQCYGNKRIKNKVACLKNWLESRRNLGLTCYHLEYGPSSEAKFFLSQDPFSRLSCPSSLRFSCLYKYPHPPKGSESRSSGPELRMGEPSWLTCTELCCFHLQRAFHTEPCWAWLDEKLCSKFQHRAGKSQIFSAIGEVRQTWLKS